MACAFQNDRYILLTDASEPAVAALARFLDGEKADFNPKDLEDDKADEIRLRPLPACCLGMPNSS